MKRLWWMSVAAMTFVPGLALASADLAKTKNCTTCHSMTQRVVGPSFKDISVKYAKQKDAEDKLTQRVMKGGGGVWGVVPMPANPQLSEADARALVKWILSQK